ncbi:MAG: phage integrase N-terminal SAM-like domain-containing protein [Sulfobacillus thermotolerans]|nr:phage integrase N-terminal SAM-like domain-containing protein [Sulfobacillus thermotolerans]
MSDDYGYAAALHRLDDDLVLRGLSQNTRASFLTHVRLFFAFCQWPVDQLTTEDIRRFLTFLIAERRVAPATANV